MFTHPTIMLLPLLFVITGYIMTSSQGGGVNALVKELHYGRLGGLSLECEDDELILVEREELGFSRTRGCHPQPMCTVPYTHASWYCRGLSICTGMQVERRPLHKRTCGSDFTNCVRVTYQCVKTSAITNICSNSVYEVQEGFLASPRFPNVYPSLRNCTCTLSTSLQLGQTFPEEGQVAAPAVGHSSPRVGHPQMELSSPFFLLKHDDPCKDVLNIELDSSRSLKKCGYLPLMGTYLTGGARINFQSDKMDQDMGFVIRFRAMTSDSKVRLQCGRNAYSKQIPPPPAVMTTTATTTSYSTTLLESMKQKDLTTSGYLISPVGLATLTESPTTSNHDLVTPATNRDSTIKVDKLNGGSKTEQKLFDVKQSSTTTQTLSISQLTRDFNGGKKKKHSDQDRIGEHRNSRGVEEYSNSEKLEEHSNSEEVKEHRSFDNVWDEQNLFPGNKRRLESSSMDDGSRSLSNGPLYRYERIETSGSNRDRTKHSKTDGERSINEILPGVVKDKSQSSLLKSDGNQTNSVQLNRESFSKQFGKSGIDEPIIYEREIQSYPPLYWSDKNKNIARDIVRDIEDDKKDIDRYRNGFDNEPENNHPFYKQHIKMSDVDADLFNDHQQTERTNENEIGRVIHKFVSQDQAELLRKADDGEFNRKLNSNLIRRTHLNNLQYAAGDLEISDLYLKDPDLRNYPKHVRNNPQDDADNNDNTAADLLTSSDVEARNGRPVVIKHKNSQLNDRQYPENQVTVLFRNGDSLSPTYFNNSLKFPVHKARFVDDATLSMNTSLEVKTNDNAGHIHQGVLFDNEDIHQAKLNDNLVATNSIESDFDVDKMWENENIVRYIPLNSNYPDDYQRKLDSQDYSAEHARVERNYKIGINDNETRIKQISFEPFDMPHEEIKNHGPVGVSLKDAENNETQQEGDLNHNAIDSYIASKLRVDSSQMEEIIKSSTFASTTYSPPRIEILENVNNYTDSRGSTSINQGVEIISNFGVMRDIQHKDLRSEILRSKSDNSETRNYADLEPAAERQLSDEQNQPNALSNATAEGQDSLDKMKELAINYYRLAPAGHHYIHPSQINQEKRLNDLKQLLSKKKLQDFNLRNIQQYRNNKQKFVELNLSERKTRVLPDDDKLDAHKYEYSLDNKLDAQKFENEQDWKRNAHKSKYELDDEEDRKNYEYILKDRASSVRKPAAVKLERQLSVTVVPLIKNISQPAVLSSIRLSIIPQNSSLKETVIKEENLKINNTTIVPQLQTSANGIVGLDEMKRTRMYSVETGIELERKNNVEETNLQRKPHVEEKEPLENQKIDEIKLKLKDKPTIINQGMLSMLDNNFANRKKSAEISIIDSEDRSKQMKKTSGNVPNDDQGSDRLPLLKLGTGPERHIHTMINHMDRTNSLTLEDLSTNQKSVSDVIDSIETGQLNTKLIKHEEDTIQWLNTFHVTQQLEMGVLKNIEIPHPTQPTKESEDLKNQQQEYGHEEHEQNLPQEEDLSNIYSMLNTADDNEAPELAVLVPARRALDGAYYFKPSDAFNDRFFSKMKPVPGYYPGVGNVHYGWNSIIGANGVLTEKTSAEAFHKSPDHAGGLDILGGRNITWAILIVGIVGWLVFAAMLGLVIHYRRKSRQTSLYSSRSSAYSSDFHIPAIRGLFTSQTFASAYPHTLDEAASTSYESVSDITDHVTNTTANGSSPATTNSSSPNIKQVASRSRVHSCRVAQQNRSTEALDENVPTACSTSRPRVSIVLPSSGCVEPGSSSSGMVEAPVPPPFFNELAAKTNAKDGKKSALLMITKSGDENNTRKMSNSSAAKCFNGSPTKKRRQLVGKSNDVISSQGNVKSTDVTGIHGDVKSSEAIGAQMMVKSNEMTDNKLFEILSSSSSQADSISAIDLMPPAGSRVVAACATNWALAPARTASQSVCGSSASSISESVERGYADMGGGRFPQKQCPISPGQIRRVVGTGATAFGATAKSGLDATGKK